MKSTLEFTLPEDANEMAVATHAGRLLSALLELDEYLRAQIKYAEHSQVTTLELQKVRNLLPHELLEELR